MKLVKYQKNGDCIQEVKFVRDKFNFLVVIN